MLRKLFMFAGFLTLSSCVATQTAVAFNNDTDEWRWFTSLSVEDQQILCTTDTECEWAFGIPIGVEGPPRLVGRGCEGASGFLYAYEEDAFPVCESIIEVEF